METIRQPKIIKRFTVTRAKVFATNVKTGEPDTIEMVYPYPYQDKEILMKRIRLDLSTDNPEIIPVYLIDVTIADETWGMDTVNFIKNAVKIGDEE